MAADSIQIELDLGNDAVPSSDVPAYDGVNDVEFGLAPGPDGQPLVHFWFQSPGIGCTKDPSQFPRDQPSGSGH